MINGPRNLNYSYSKSTVCRNYSVAFCCLQGAELRAAALVHECVLTPSGTAPGEDPWGKGGLLKNINNGQPSPMLNTSMR